MSEKIQCPNCGEQAEKAGNKITCQACDSVFKVTKTGSASVEQIGWKEKMENRIDILEKQTCYEPDPEAAAAAAAAPETDEDEDEEEPILPE